MLLCSAVSKIYFCCGDGLTRLYYVALHTYVSGEVLRPNAIKQGGGGEELLRSFFGYCEMQPLIFVVTVDHSDVVRSPRSAVAALGDRVKCSDLFRKLLIDASCFKRSQ
jgi:hypothetical protein